MLLPIRTHARFLVVADVENRAPDRAVDGVVVAAVGAVGAELRAGVPCRGGFDGVGGVAAAAEVVGAEVHV